MVAAPGTYAEAFDAGRKIGPVGLTNYAIAAGTPPEAFLRLRGDARRPGRVVVDGGGRRPCVVSHGLTILVEGITCRNPAPVGLDLAGSSALLDDVVIRRPAVAGIAVEDGQIYLGGVITVVGVGGGGFGLSVRSGTSVREGTLLNRNVHITTRGGRMGIFIRDRSSFSIVGVVGGHNSVDLGDAYFGINLQEGCSLFFGRNAPLKVHDVYDAITVQSLSSLDVTSVYLRDVHTGVKATKRSVVSYTPIEETRVSESVSVDGTSSILRNG